MLGHLLNSVVTSSVQRRTVLPEDLATRAEATADLLAARGYAVTPKRLSKLMLGGPVDPASIEALVDSRSVKLEDGRLVTQPVDVETSKRRQEAHANASTSHWEYANAYLARLARHCPWLRVAMIGGSLASEGFELGDDIDLDLVVEDGTKYTSYLVALFVGLPLTWRHRRHASKANTPILPKLFCLNVVWEEGQTKPFERQDPLLGMELLLARPVYGSETYAQILRENPGLLQTFPQLERPVDTAGDPKWSWRGRILAALTRRPLTRKLLEGASYRIVRFLHAWVRWHRRHDPTLLAHVDEMETHKRPYGILERP